MSTASRIAPESLNLAAEDAVSGTAVLVGIAAAAARRERLNGKIVSLAWVQGRVLAETSAAGSAVYLANALGLPRTGASGKQTTLPRTGNLSGVTVIVNVGNR